MNASIDAARQIQRHAIRQTFHICKACEKPLSIAEFIERHCERWAKDVEVVATKERS